MTNRHPAAAQVDGVERFLEELEPRSRVLDLGCGDGQRTLELSRRGHRVLGAGPDERAFAHARAQARTEKLNAHFMKVDPKGLAYRAEFDAVLGLDGLLGAGEREDARVLDCVRKALKPGARLLLDGLNREWLLRHFEPNFGSRGVAFDFETGRLEGRRIYSLVELKGLLEDAELSYRRCWGAFDGADYGMDSPRLIALAVRTTPLERRRSPRPDDGLPRAIRIKGRR